MPNNGQRLRCTIIGAGVSGILMAYKIQTHLSGYVDFTIYEKSPDLGGTWYENRYPGCSCDVPSHCYQYSFAPNPSWSQFYATSQEIKAYLERVVDHFNLRSSIRFNSKIISARWSADSATWTAQVEDGPAIESELLINAGGILNHLQMPDIRGLSQFSGPILHTAAWDSSIELKDKRVAVIGSGASSVQLVPQLQPIARSLEVYIRTPSWICPPVVLPEPGKTNYTYTKRDQDRFQFDRDAYLRERKNLESHFNAMFRAFLKGSPEQKQLRGQFEERMKELIPDEDLQRHLIPDFAVGCRRINPGEGFLVSLQQPNVKPVFDKIERITSTGVMAGGRHHPADVLVAATGFNTTFRPRFPLYGEGGINLQDLWDLNPISYMGMAVSGFPNYLISLGPNTPISNGSVMGPLEATSDFFVRIIRKMIRQNIKSFDVHHDAQTDFDAHTQAFMKDTVWTGTCRSWFKRGTDGKVTALWPGSSLHYMQVLAENRWEDFRWRYKTERFAYWGRGISWIEEPNMDPLGIDEQESMLKANTVPKRGHDISFYLWNSPPLPLPATEVSSTELTSKSAASTDDITGKSGGGIQKREYDAMDITHAQGVDQVEKLAITV